MMETSCGFEMVHSSASFSRGQLHPRAMCYDCSQFCVLDLAADSTKATCHWQESCDACVGRVPFLTRGENIIPSGNLTWLLKMAIYSEFSHEKW